MKGKKGKTIILLLGLMLMLGFFKFALGSNSYLTPFNNQNGTTYNCGVCHTTASGSSSARNQFGADWANASIGNHSYAITAALGSRDSDGDGFTNLVEIQANTNPGSATSYPSSGGDTILPVVTGFTIPSSSNTLTVSITSLTATDNIGVTGYLITETSAKPGANAAGWSTSVPAGYTVASAGTKTLYAWAKDASGNVSNSLSRQVTVTATGGGGGGNGGGSSNVSITDFAIPFSSSTLTVPIQSFTASGPVAGYLVTEMAMPVTPPSAGASGWRSSPPRSYTFGSEGMKALYAWVKDGAGNISEPWSLNVLVSRRDTSSPQVMSFNIPSSGSSLVVPISDLTAIDDVGVTGYLVTTASTKPLASAPGWSASPPSSFTLTSGGTITLYAWAKDGAGNVSDSLSETITLSGRRGGSREGSGEGSEEGSGEGSRGDTISPRVTAFSIPSQSGSLRVSIRTFTATDNVAVTGFLVTESSTKPAANASGWGATAPTSYTFSSGGTKRLYAWAKDRAGNVSNSLSATVRITQSGREGRD